MRLFDAHCHLQDEKLLPRIDAAMERAGQAGVCGFCCCGASESDWPVVMTLASRFKQITPAFGLHPWYVARRTLDWQNVLRYYLTLESGSGVGEIGLDRAIEERNDAKQVEVFLAQLRLAKELGRPVTIHCRKAWDVVPALLEGIGGLPAGFVLHSYSGSSELVEPLTKLGAYFSFSGSITYHRNRRGHKAVMAVPPDRLLIETDSPDLLPVVPLAQPGDAAAHNEPANLVHVLRKIAELRKMPEDELAELTWKNAERVFAGGE
jgi:TatD DNase family protein